MRKPLVSVVMSEYNTDPFFFHESVRSILGQSYEDFELIIVDDCGNNDIDDLLKLYSDDKRIIVIRNKKNCGLARSLNRGVKKARGKYIIRMDTDDIMMPDRIKKQVEFAEHHPEYAIIGGRYILFDGEKEYGVMGVPGEKSKEDLLPGTPFAHPTLIIHKDALLKNNGYPSYERCEDYAMELGLYISGYKGYVMNDVLIKYRQDKNGYLKKRYKYRVEGFQMRKKYFRKLGVPRLKWLAYSAKPLFVGLIPKRLLKQYHEKGNS
ncbi:glycosyltransferase [Candidatus Saccharibacteria bacterium]|nr:glycosyltransferase [Candidatus Saccharibacteria bacterium]